MKFKRALKTLIGCIGDQDVALYSGSELCRVAKKFARSQDIMLGGVKSPAAVVAGLANAVEERVVLFCDDDTLLEDLSSFAQMAVTRCRNVFCVVLHSGIRRGSGTYTLSESVASLKGLLFNMGFVIHNYTPHFETNYGAEEVRLIWTKAQGPLVAFLDVEGE